MHFMKTQAMKTAATSYGQKEKYPSQTNFVTQVNKK